jgi:hypothetical protein
MNPLPRLFEWLEQIDLELENGYTPADIRTMKPEEVAALVRFARELQWSARRLTNTLKLAEIATDDNPFTSRLPKRPQQRVSGIIDSLDHPVLKKIEERHRQDREQAARICRRGFRDTTDDLPTELLPTTNTNKTP